MRKTRLLLAVAGLLLCTAAPALAQNAPPTAPRAATAPTRPIGQTEAADPTAAPDPATAARVTEVPTSGGGASALPGLRLTRNGDDFELPIQMLMLLTVLTLAPSIIILMTSFTRLVVVFSILRTALGMQQAPPSQVLIGLSLFLTLFIMNPVLQKINDDALQPYLNGEISQNDALMLAVSPAKAFMLGQVREKDLLLFMDMAGQTGSFATAEDVPLHILVPAFVISELRIAFQIGFLLFLPFLVVDLIVSSVLMSLGMMMLPPVTVSLPIKLLLFVLTDGWYLLVESVVRGYMGV